MSTTTGNQQTYTRQELNSKTVEELKNICRQDRQKYAGFSNYTKIPLIEFILRGGKRLTSGSTTGGYSLRTVPRNQRQVRNLSRNRSITHNKTHDFTDFSTELIDMFSEKVSAYESEFDNFEIDDNDCLFNPCPHDDFRFAKILSIEEEILSFDKYAKISFEPYVDDYKSEMYSIHKKHLYVKNGALGNEEILLHGTDECNIEEILENDFSLTINTKHGNVFGKGIYFTNSIRKAMEYSERSKTVKYVILSYVYIGDIVQGMSTMDIHPKIPGKDKRYDTSVDNVHNPIQFIKKSNNQYNIIGILKIELTSMEKHVLPRLPCNLHITNNTTNSIVVLFSFNPFVDLDSYKKSKNLSTLRPGETSRYNTTYGHYFACTNIKNSTFDYYDCLKKISINQKYSHVQIGNGPIYVPNPAKMKALQKAFKPLYKNKK